MLAFVGVFVVGGGEYMAVVVNVVLIILPDEMLSVISTVFIFWVHILPGSTLLVIISGQQN